MRELTTIEIEAVTGGGGSCPKDLPKTVTIRGKEYTVSCTVKDGRVQMTLTPVKK